MSGPTGRARDSILFLKFYYPDSFFWYILSRKTESEGIQIQTAFSKPVEKKDSNAVSQFTRWKANGFNERVVKIAVSKYENIAQAWVTAEVKPKENEALTYRVQDSFQLFYDGKRWWIMSIAWQPETTWHKISVY